MFSTYSLPKIISTENDGIFSISIEEGNDCTIVVLKWGRTEDSINNGVRVKVGKGYDPQDVCHQIEEKINSGDKKFLAFFKKEARVSVKRGNYPQATTNAYYKKRRCAYLSA